jgi:hypothetical protein
MKQILVLLGVFGCLTVNAQEAKVEKSFFGIQTGVLGLWIHNESRIGKKISLRSEIGINGVFWQGFDIYEGDKSGFYLGPVITLEPRYYYFLGKRSSKQKSISYNSGNFFSLHTSYQPDWFAISNQDLNTVSTIFIAPTWGMRRNIGTSSFNYEVGIGLGYRYNFYKAEGYTKNNGDAAANLHLRIGYTF